MKIETDEKKEKTLIFIRFPSERREVFYYQSIEGKSKENKHLNYYVSKSPATFGKLNWYCLKIIDISE
jgi:hypothetical protein